MDREELLKESDRLLSIQGGGNKAAEIRLSLLKDDPDNVNLMIKAANALYFSEDWGERRGDSYEKIDLMFQLLERAVELEPDNPDTHGALASLLDLWAQGDKQYYRRAASEYKRALELDPKDVFAAIGVVQHRDDLNLSLEQSIEILENARANKPEQYRLLYELGNLYRRNNELEKALYTLELALELVLSEAPEGREDGLKRGLPGTIEKLKRTIREKKDKS